MRTQPLHHMLNSALNLPCLAWFVNVERLPLCSLSSVTPDIKCPYFSHQRRNTVSLNGINDLRRRSILWANVSLSSYGAGPESWMPWARYQLSASIPHLWNGRVTSLPRTLWMTRRTEQKGVKNFIDTGSVCWGIQGAFPDGQKAKFQSECIC